MRLDYVLKQRRHSIFVSQNDQGGLCELQKNHFLKTFTLVAFASQLQF